jgi:hypothetical protein
LANTPSAASYRRAQHDDSPSACKGATRGAGRAVWPAVPGYELLHWCRRFVCSLLLSSDVDPPRQRCVSPRRTIQSSEESSEDHRGPIRGAFGRAAFASAFKLVHGKGVEPLCLAAAEPKSAASACFATRAAMILLKISRSYSESFGVACDRRGCPIHALRQAPADRTQTSALGLRLETSANSAWSCRAYCGPTTSALAEQACRPSSRWMRSCDGGRGIECDGDGHSRPMGLRGGQTSWSCSWGSARHMPEKNP